MWRVLLLCALAHQAGAHSAARTVTLWTELPNVVAQGSFQQVQCYYERLTKTVLDGIGKVQFGRLIVRVEDPWYNDWSTEPMNGWLFNPDRTHWAGDPRPSNPLHDMLVNLKRELGSRISIFALPQLHQGAYFRWPCYPIDLPNRTIDCNAVPGYLAAEDIGALHCGGPPTPPSDNCSAVLRPNGCSCGKSWDCVSNWCEHDKCSVKPGRRQAQSLQKCAISSAVRGDPNPYGHCCQALTVQDQQQGEVTLDFTEMPCCDAVESEADMCNRAEVSAKGGVIPCLNPLNRLGYWVWKWNQLLQEQLPTQGFDGIVFDLESTGLSDTTLLKGIKHYLSHYLGPKTAANMQIGCTVGNTLPAPNSLYEGYDFWVLEAYNLFSAKLDDSGKCTQFLVDSLPRDNQGQCSRSCKSSTCSAVFPSCDTSIYQQHLNDPSALVGATSQQLGTFRSLLVPEATTNDCTTSWGPLLNKQYEYAYDQAKAKGADTEHAKAIARAAVQAVFNKTIVMFSTETRMRDGQSATCLYPDDSDCGVPRAFGSWELHQFWAFVEVHFRTLSGQIKMDDGTTDQISFSWLPENYAGLFQFSFLPTAWLTSSQLDCSRFNTTTTTDM